MSASRRWGSAGGGLGGGPGRARRGVAASAVVVARGRRRSASGAALLWRNRLWRPRRVNLGSRLRRIGERGSVLLAELARSIRPFRAGVCFHHGGNLLVCDEMRASFRGHPHATLTADGRYVRRSATTENVRSFSPAPSARVFLIDIPESRKLGHSGFGFRPSGFPIDRSAPRCARKR